MTTTPTASPELPDLDHLEALARAADQGEGQHIYTNPRDSNGWQANEAWHRAASPDAVLALIALARRAQPESEAPQADWQTYALNLRAVLERGYKSLASAAMAQTRDGEAAWYAMGEALKVSGPPATLSPLCGAQQAAAPRTDLSKRIRAAATADVTLAQAKLLIGAAEEIERAQQAAAPGALATEAAKLAPILRGMCEGGDVHGDGVDIYADGYIAVDGDTYVVRAAALLEQIAAPSAPGTPEAPKRLTEEEVRELALQHLHDDTESAGRNGFFTFSAEGLDGFAIDLMDSQRAAQLDGGQEGALARCAAGRDGECGHKACPQLRDKEPVKSGRHCPLDQEGSESNG